MGVPLPSILPLYAVIVLLIRFIGESGSFGCGNGSYKLENSKSVDSLFILGFKGDELLLVFSFEE